MKKDKLKEEAGDRNLWPYKIVNNIISDKENTKKKLKNMLYIEEEVG